MYSTEYVSAYPSLPFALVHCCTRCCISLGLLNMSALQLEDFLGERHRAEYGTNGQNKYVHLFVYDRYYSWTKFQKEFPNATMGGVGWLNGWEWHIQSSGRLLCSCIYALHY